LPEPLGAEAPGVEALGMGAEARPEPLGAGPDAVTEPDELGTGVFDAGA
jgi:hypothetical protein